MKRKEIKNKWNVIYILFYNKKILKILLKKCSRNFFLIFVKKFCIKKKFCMKKKIV